MNSTSPAAAPTVFLLLANERLSDLRASYIENLHRDRLALVDLAAELASPGREPLEPLMRLRLLAHRIRGAAAIFNVPTVEDATEVLEMTTRVDEACPDKGPAPKVHNALETLVDCMARIAG